MKKATYNITGNYGGKRSQRPVTGYIFKYNGHRFGVTNMLVDGTKIDRLWTVSELTTGFMLFDGYNRRNAIDRIKEMTESQWNAVRRAVEANEDVNPGLLMA